MPLTLILDLAWQMACVETTAAKMQFIEPEHLLAAMTKLRQLCDGEPADAALGAGEERRSP